jgi:nicotinamidase-related amidase
VALLVIDMLEDFLRGPFAGPGGELLIGRVSRVLDGARARSMPVLFICDVHAADDREFSVMAPHALEGSPGAAIVAELAPRPGEQLVSKRRYSGFFNTDLEDRLRALGDDTVVLCGLQTDCCVLHTAADGFFRDFSIVVLEDATSARTTDGHARGLEQMKRLYGAQVVSTDHFLQRFGR